jgi:hypothetical protein
MKLLLPLAEKVIMSLVQDKSVKLFVIELLAKYSATTDNDIDDMVVSLVRSKLIK